MLKISIEKNPDGWWHVNCPCCPIKVKFVSHEQAMMFASSHADQIRANIDRMSRRQRNRQRRAWSAGDTARQIRVVPVPAGR